MPMDSKTYITLDLQAPNVAVVAAGKQNDLASRKIVAKLRDGETLWTPPVDAAAMIRYAKPDSTAGFYDVLEDGTTPAWSVNGSTITITLCEQMLTVAGRVWVEINFYTSTAKLTTFYFLLEVQRSVLEDATIISSDYYNVLSAQIQALLGATANPPQIDPNTKNWLLWDEDAGEYVDSGYSSVGTTGPQGPQGVSISTVTKASGTGAPGTTDTYNVNKTDGTVAGQFNVYNGANGQGSPGSATPLSDRGSGVVGTAIAYAREDHQHPLNVDSTNPADLGTASPGSSSAYARRDHVHAMPPYGAQNNITSGTHDLNDYKTAGVYYFSAGAPLSNAPNSALDGWLTVYQSSDGACKQVWQREGSNPKNFKDFYMRLYYESAWGDWFAITDGNGVIRYKDFSFGISFSGGTAGTFAGVKDFDIALSGWTPISICMYKAPSAGTILCYPMINISANTARLAYGRWATGAYNETVTVRVAYVKE